MILSQVPRPKRAITLHDRGELRGYLRAHPVLEATHGLLCPSPWLWKSRARVWVTAFCQLRRTPAEQQKPSAEGARAQHHRCLVQEHLLSRTTCLGLFPIPLATSADEALKWPDLPKIFLEPAGVKVLPEARCELWSPRVNTGVTVCVFSIGGMLADSGGAGPRSVLAGAWERRRRRRGGTHHGRNVSHHRSRDRVR